MGSVPENFHGVKGRSGRPTDREIVKKWVDEDLANSIANRELQRIKDQENIETKDMSVIVMPIVLKGMTEKKDINANVSMTVNIDKDIADTFNINDCVIDTEPKDNSEGQTPI